MSPERVSTGRARRLGEADVDAIAVGAAILGTGGGGNPYIGSLRAKEQLRAGGVIAGDVFTTNLAPAARRRLGHQLVSSTRSGTRGHPVPQLLIHPRRLSRGERGGDQRHAGRVALLAGIAGSPDVVG